MGRARIFFPRIAILYNVKMVMRYWNVQDDCLASRPLKLADAGVRRNPYSGLNNLEIDKRNSIFNEGCSFCDCFHLGKCVFL